MKEPVPGRGRAPAPCGLALLRAACSLPDKPRTSSQGGSAAPGHARTGLRPWGPTRHGAPGIRSAIRPSSRLTGSITHAWVMSSSLACQCPSRVHPSRAPTASPATASRPLTRRPLAVTRQRSDADLAWETDLLRHLDREGMTVPTPIPATDGRHFAGGLVVMTYVEGGPSGTEADWRRVAGILRQLHRLTQGWPQRPGWRSSTDLLQAETGTRVNLGAMPPDGVARCRAAWARLAGRATCVVHGDPNPGNIRMTVDRVAMIDWDESHVDVPDLDLALPHNAAGLGNDAYDIAAQARAAWAYPSR